MGMLQDFKDMPGDAPKAVECLNELIVNALGHAMDCLKYLERLQDVPVFRFCAIPQVRNAGVWHFGAVPQERHGFLEGHDEHFSIDTEPWEDRDAPIPEQAPQGMFLLWPQLWILILSPACASWGGGTSRGVCGEGR